MKSTRKDLWVGVFVAVGFLGGALFVSWRLLESYWFNRPWRVVLQMPQGYGLVAGSRVKLRDVPVGTVADVDLDESGGVRASLGIERRSHALVTEGARFTVERPMVWGDPWVEILPGPGTELPEGAVRPVEPPGETLADLGITKESITAMVEGMSRAVDQANAIMSSARDPGTSIGRLLTEDRLYQDLTSLTGELRGTLADLRGGEGQTRETVERLNTLLADADRTVVEIGSLARRVNEGEGTLGRFAGDPAVYEETRRILAELRETLQDLREQAPISTFLGALLGAF
ncbi:MAG: MCE family protein [Planctomycetes bacterium]|nr:MCE family protein [Planctomycetota bacterium]